MEKTNSVPIKLENGNLCWSALIKFSEVEDNLSKRTCS